MSGHRYKEVQEQRFWQERLGTRDVDELGIDTNASFLADAMPQPPPPAALPLPPPPVAVNAVALRPQSAPHISAPRPAVKEKAGGTPIIIVPSGCVCSFSCIARTQRLADWDRRCSSTCTMLAHFLRTPPSYRGRSAKT